MNRRKGHDRFRLFISIVSVFILTTGSHAAGPAPMASYAPAAPAAGGSLLKVGTTPRLWPRRAGERVVERPEPQFDRTPKAGVSRDDASNAARTLGRQELADITSYSLAPRRFEAPGVPTGERTTLVVDIDETLCVTDYNSVLWGIGKDDSQPLPNSQKTLSLLSREYNILYLTARPTTCANKTQRWLTSRGFPSGPLVTSPTLGDFLGQTDFKRKMLARLQQQNRRVLIGIGDKPTDAEAYRDNGMLPVIVNPWRDRTYRQGEIVMRDWQALSSFFELNRASLTSPDKLGESLRRSALTVQLPR